MLKDTLKRNETAAANADALAVLRENFAGCFTKEGAFDLKAFAAQIRDKVAVTEEGYQLDFLGKNYARLLANEETETVIVPDEAHNAKPENAKSQNVYISGDNLDALKHLLKSYEHEVKCIYIDPPYNTGSDGFVYNDNFKFKPDELARKLSITEEEAKKLLDFVGRGSASHSAWLMFMYPRLQLAKSLLRDDGVIFISIDDNEQANLKLLCDDIFGERNFIAQFIWRGGRRNAAKFVSTSHEYMLAYAAKLSYCDENDISWREQKKGLSAIYTTAERLVEESNGDYELASKKLKDWYESLPDDDPSKDHDHYSCIDKNGVYFPSDISRGGGGGPKWAVVNPATGNVVTPPARGWAYSTKEELDADIANDLIHFNGDGVPCKKRYLKDNETQLRETVFYKDRRGSSKRLRSLMGAEVFDFPKDEEVLRGFIETFTDKNSLIVDFFSGSASTAHAVLAANKADCGARRYVAVQIAVDMDERVRTATGLSKKSAQATLDFLIAQNCPHALDYVGIERIKKAANKIHAENPLFAGDLGFKHFTLAKPSGEVLEKIESFDPKASLLATQDMLKEFGVGTVLATWLNHDGYGLTREAEKVDLAGYEAYLCGHHLYLVNANFGAKNVKALLEKYETDKAFTPDKIVLFGYSFAWKELEELDTNLKKLKTTRNINADLDIRY